MPDVERQSEFQVDSSKPKYIIFGAMRSGTTVLNESLELHPSLNVAYEILHYKSSIELTNLPHIRDLLEDAYGIRKLEYTPSSMLGAHPRFPDDVGLNVGAGSFINDYNLSELVRRVFDEYNGFKILYYQVKRNNALWDYLRDYPNLKVIHILRDNFLDCLVSLMVAHNSGIWQLQRWGHLEPDRPVRIDPQDAKCYFEYLSFSREHYLSMFEDRDQLVVKYEDIGDWNSLMRKVQRFLEVDYVELLPKYRKRMNDHSNKIANFGELRRFFNGTKWSHFFDREVKLI